MLVFASLDEKLSGCLVSYNVEKALGNVLAGFFPLINCTADTVGST